MSVYSLKELRERLTKRDDDPESWLYVLQLIQERDEARANARILAHSYVHDSRPPEGALNASLAYPVWGAGTAQGDPL